MKTKNIVKLLVFALIAALSVSCENVRLVKKGQGGYNDHGPMQYGGYGRPQHQQGGYGYQQHQQGHGPEESFNMTYRQTGYCEARIWQGPANTPENRQLVSEYASKAYMKTGHTPTESELTQKFGFRAQARWIDTDDKVIKTVTVRPDEVPEHIRKQFEQ